MVRRKHVRLALAALGIVALATWGVPLAFFTALQWRFNPTPSYAAHPPPATLADADLQDLTDLDQMLALDHSFSPSESAAFREGLAALRANAGMMPPARFTMEVARLAALSGNGHTMVDPGEFIVRFVRAPIDLAWFEEGLFIVGAAPSEAHLLGARVHSIAGHSLDEAFAALRPFISGTDEWARVRILRFLTSPPLLQAVWPDTDPDNLLLHVEMMDGRMMERTVDAIRFEAPNRRVYAAGWKYLTDDRTGVAPSLLEPRRILLRSELENGGLYIRLNGIVDDDNGPLEEQLSDVLAGAPQGGWRWIVVDLRDNGGGSYEKAAAFSRALPEALSNDGSLWLLSNHGTFSAAIATLARAKYFAGARARIVGERVGDRDQFWSERGPLLVLRNSKIALHYATGRHDWVNGCYALDCYWLDFFYQVPARDLKPEIEMRWSFADYAEGRDTVLEHVRSLVRNGSTN
jgi:hypothetical protein